MVEVIVALTLLSQPEGTETLREMSCCAPVIRRACESLDFFWPKAALCDTMQQDRPDFDFQHDLDLCRRWYEQMRDAPPVGDVHRLPTREALEEWMAFNRTHKEWLEHKQVGYSFPPLWIEYALGETERLHDVLLAAWRARGAESNWWIKVYLKQLRRVAGEEAYWSGQFSAIPNYK